MFIVSLIAVLIIFINYIIIKALPFNKAYKNGKDNCIKEAILIFVLIIICYFSMFADFLGAEYVDILYAIGWTFTFLLLVKAIQEITYGLVIMKSGKELSLVSDDDIPKNIRIIFEPFSSDTSAENNKQSFKEKFRKILPAMLLFSYMVFVFGVFEPYFANIDEWKFRFWSLLIPSLVVFAAVIGITAVISIFLGSRSSDLITVLMTALCIIAYVQSNFLNQKTFIDGNALETSHKDLLINLVLWIVVGIIPIYCYRFWKKQTVKAAVYASLVLLVMQVAPLPYMLIKGSAAFTDNEYDAYCLSGDKQFEVSSDENVIVFIMDTYYSGYLSEYIAEHPEYSTGVFSDFTFFDNVTTETCATAFSMPSLLTNHDIDYSISLLDSNASAWKSSEAVDFYGKMQEKGYKVRLYTDNDRYCGDAENMIGKINNVLKYRCSYATEMFPTYSAMLKLSLYRYSPLFMKKLFYVPDILAINQYTKSTSQEDIRDVSNFAEISRTAKEYGMCYYNADYYQSLKEGLTTVSDEKLCIFQHIYGMHTPFMGVDNNELDEQTSSSYALYGCMTIFEEYIRQLKDIGVYDSSTIILAADHGIQYKLNKSNPVMLIKPAGVTKNAMTINSAPGVLQDDLLPTILDCVGMESASNAGYSLFDLDENMSRSRVIRIFDKSEEFKRVPKCTGVGYSLFNCYIEYTFDGRIEDVDFRAMEGETKAITDFWW